MAETFDPAPPDKHADQSKPGRADKTDDDLQRGLTDSFPASDPPSSTQPAKKPNDAG